VRRPVTKGLRDRIFVVVGFTRRGKVRMARLHAATEMTAWWATIDRLPRHYHYVGTIPPGWLDELIGN
jgi:hypothetical protein